MIGDLNETYERVCTTLDTLNENLKSLNLDESFRPPRQLPPPEHQTYEFSVSATGINIIVDPRPTPVSVSALLLVAAGTVTVSFGYAQGGDAFSRFRSVSGIGGVPLVAQSIIQMATAYPSELFSVPAGEGFAVNLSTNVAVSGFVTFYQTETTRAAVGQ